MGKHRPDHHHSSSSNSMQRVGQLYPAMQMQPGMQMQPSMQLTPGMQSGHMQPVMQMQPVGQMSAPQWQMQPMQFAKHPHDCMSDTTLELPGSPSDESDDYSDSGSSSRTKDKSKHKRKRQSSGRHHKKDKGRKAKKVKHHKKKDTKKSSDDDDQDAAAFPGTTYRFLGGKELPGSTAERAKQSYPKSHKVAILKEMCSIITVTRSACRVYTATCLC
jgi:hypothetical protein